MTSLSGMLKSTTASMKVPARRRGNPATFFNGSLGSGLNESPRPKAGKLKPLEAISELVSLNESPRPKAGKFHEWFFMDDG